MTFDILIIDDEKDIRDAACGILEDEGYCVRCAADTTDVTRVLSEKTPDLVILDVWLQGSNKDGLEILAELKNLHSNLPVVMISGHGTIDTAVSAIKRGAYDFIQKPFSSDRLLLVVKRALEASDLRKENAALRRESQKSCEIIGQSASTKNLRDIVRKAACTKSMVLIKGQAGTGKTLVARAIHEENPAEEEPFVFVNCASTTGDELSKILLDTQGGNVVLDAVDGLSSDAQAALLGCVQNTTARIISTTMIELKDSDFRQDLYYRLAVVPIEIAPLRERPDDIESMAKAFMDDISSQHGMPVRTISPAALSALQLYDWPGNVRQLRNAIELMMILHSEDAKNGFEISHLPPEITGLSDDNSNGKLSGDVLSLPLRPAREKFEADYITAQLRRFDGSITRTSDFIGMERSALHRKIKSLGLSLL